MVTYFILLLLPLFTMGIYVHYYLDTCGWRMEVLLPFVLVIGLAMWKLPQLQSMGFACLFFCITNILVSNYAFNYSVFFKDCLHKKEEYLAKVDGFKVLQEFDSKLEARFWLSEKERKSYNEVGCFPYDGVTTQTAGFMGMLIDKRLGTSNLFDYPGPATFAEIPETTFLKTVPPITCGCLYPEEKEMPANFEIDLFVVLSVFEKVIDDATERFKGFEKVHFQLDKKVQISHPPIEYWIGMYKKNREA